MKTKLFLSLSLMFCFLFVSQQAQAQRVFNDTIMIFNERLEFVAGGNFVQKGTVFSLDKSSTKLQPISATQAQKLVLPRAVKVSDGPVTLHHDGKCYKFGCVNEQGCQNCKLVWWDRNDDGQVQPRRELRCKCPTGGTCKMRVEKVPCR